MMLVQTDALYRCDGCGMDKVNPEGWSYLLSPMLGDPRTDHRLNNKIQHVCSECGYAIRDFLKSRFQS
jgi:hypothetical protein